MQNAVSHQTPTVFIVDDEEGMRNALLRDRVFKGGADVLLAHEFGENLRTVFARDDLIHV
jgi:hypothetical protein